MKKRKFNLSGLVAFVLAVLVLLVLIPVNIIANYYNKDYDMTPSSMYTLNSITKDLVKQNKDKDIVIYTAFTLKEIQDYTPYLPLYHTLAELKDYDNITIKEFVPDEEPDLVEQLDPNNALSISLGDIIVKHGDIIKKIEAASIFPYDENDVSAYAGEELIAGAIKIVTSGSLPKIYFLTGHGEKSISNEYYEYAEYLKLTNNYEAAELDLTSVDSVPDDTAIIFLAGPQTDITDDEKAKLPEYAEEGGAMSFFLPPVEEKVRFENIEDVLAESEIEMHYNILEETNPTNILSSASAMEMMSGDEGIDDNSDPRVFAVDYTPATDSFTEDLTTGILEMVADGDIGGISNTRSFTGLDSNNAFIEKSPIIQNRLNTDSTGLSTGYSAVSVPYGGDEETAEYAETLSGQLLYPAFYSYNKQNGAKLLTFGTSDILESKNMPQTTWLTQMLSLSSLIWLFDSNYDMEIGKKSVSFDYMSFPSADEATSTLRIFTIVPICIAVIGLLVWLKRRHS